MIRSTGNSVQSDGYDHFVIRGRMAGVNSVIQAQNAEELLPAQIELHRQLCRELGQGPSYSLRGGFV